MLGKLIGTGKGRQMVAGTRPSLAQQVAAIHSVRSLDVLLVYFRLDIKHRQDLLDNHMNRTQVKWHIQTGTFCEYFI